MFIQTETTPNPNTLKFLPGQEVLKHGAMQFDSTEEATASPLASQLFRVKGVHAVFLGTDFISVTRHESQEWATLKPMLLGAIMDHFLSGLPAVNDEVNAQVHGEDGDADSEIVIQIRDLLDNRVRPVVAQDGGDILFHGFREGTVYLTMRGACAGCPSSTATLKGGIEALLKHYIPEVIAVEAVN